MALSHSGSSKRGCSEVNNAIHAVTCLVDGCAADLSDCRKYYQRHKVCEVHSKSPQVPVHGQNLRFCQQCSRFHSLEEFDEGKRSCRKRLDGHNRRRRKPRPYPLPQDGADMVQPAGAPMQVHPTMGFTNPLWSGVVEAPAWVDYSSCAPSLLSSRFSSSHASCSTLSNVVHPPSDCGSVSVTTSAMDQGVGYGGWEDDCDMGWSGLSDMDPHYHEYP